MKVFVAGATGVIGKRAVAALVTAGHEVTGMARSSEKEELLRSLGADAARVDLFDPEALREAVAGHHAVVNLATHIPPLSRAARMSAWEENERIRRQGSRNLVDAALAAGAQLYVQESIAFLYGDHSDEWVDAETPLVETVHSESVRVAEGETARFAEQGGRGIVLRFGRFVAADAHHTRDLLRITAFGVFPEPGSPDGYLPIIHADDAAAAVVAALDAPSGTYDVVDDRPMTRDEQREALRDVLDRRLVRIPRPLTRLVGRTAAHLVNSQRVSNRRFKETAGWQPAFPEAASAYRQVVEELGARRPRPSIAVRVALWVLLLSGLGAGVQAQFTPESFYADFPFGRGWVAAYPAFSEHLVRDVGGLFLGLTAVTAVAMWSARRSAIRAVAAGWVVFQVPHLWFHAANPMSIGTLDDVMSLTGLAIVLVAALVALVGRIDDLPGGRLSPFSTSSFFVSLPPHMGGEEAKNGLGGREAG